jgi:Fe-S cluster assembly scaffold IscU
MAYSKKVLEHYEHPLNVGTLDKNNKNVGTGWVGAPEAGEVMRLQIEVDPETQMIIDAKFKTFGCGSTIASASLATEWLRGKSIDEAMVLDNLDIVEELALPPLKIHCSVLAEDAVKSAINDYMVKNGMETIKLEEKATH